ncbi:hypothetical protein [Jannaschia formosa]|nr:hypothetical protein [Jannaschia formosa]
MNERTQVELDRNVGCCLEGGGNRFDAISGAFSVTVSRGEVTRLIGQGG